MEFDEEVCLLIQFEWFTIDNSCFLLFVFSRKLINYTYFLGYFIGIFRITNREPEIVFNLFDEWLLSLGNERTLIDRRTNAFRDICMICIESKQFF